MAMIVHLPDDLARRLEAEASRRGVSVEEIAVEALEGRYGRSVPTPADGGADALAAFIGCASSGQAEPFDIRQARAEAAARKFAEGA